MGGVDGVEFIFKGLWGYVRQKRLGTTALKDTQHTSCCILTVFECEKLEKFQVLAVTTALAQFSQQFQFAKLSTQNDRLLLGPQNLT